MRLARSLSIALALAVALLVGACTDPGPPEEAPLEAEPGEAATSTSSPPEETVEVPTAAPTEEPAEEPGGESGVGLATLSIGDDTWFFDRVDFCAMSPPENETESFIMIAQQDGVQLVAQVTDPTGERRLEGDGVWGSIQVVEPPQMVEGYEVFPGWLASGEASGEQFIVVDGLSVTASAKFDDFAGEFQQIPGTLQATCP